MGLSPASAHLHPLCLAPRIAPPRVARRPVAACQYIAVITNFASHDFSSHRRRFVCGSPCAGKRTRPTHYTAVMANAVTNDRPRQWADGRLGSNCSFRRRLQAGLRRLHRRGPGKGRAGAKKPREGTRQRASASVLSRQRPVPCACCELELGGSGCLSRCRPASPDGQN